MCARIWVVDQREACYSKMSACGVFSPNAGELQHVFCFLPVLLYELGGIIDHSVPQACSI